MSHALSVATTQLVLHPLQLMLLALAAPSPFSACAHGAGFQCSTTRGAWPRRCCAGGDWLLPAAPHCSCRACGALAHHACHGGSA